MLDICWHSVDKICSRHFVRFVSFHKLDFYLSGMNLVVAVPEWNEKLLWIIWTYGFFILRNIDLYIVCLLVQYVYKKRTIIEYPFIEKREKKLTYI